MTGVNGTEVIPEVEEDYRRVVARQRPGEALCMKWAQRNQGQGTWWLCLFPPIPVLEEDEM